MRALAELQKVQQVSIGNERAFIVPHHIWRRIILRLEELDDERAYDAAKTTSDQTTIEHDEVCRMLGESPLRYLRLQAALTQAELAKKARLSQSYIAKVELGDKPLSTASRNKLARALKIAPEMLSI